MKQRWIVLVAVALVAGVASLAALHLVSGTRGKVGPGTVELHAKTALRGRSELALPPLGTLSARTHGAPVQFTATVQELNIEQVQQLLATEDPQSALRTSMTRDLSRLARKFALRVLFTSIAIGAVVGLIAPRRHWPSIVAGATGGLVIPAALLITAWAGFHEDAFSKPRFDGPLERAPAILRTARKHIDGLDDIRRRIDTLGERLSDLYEAALPAGNGEAVDEVRILHVSDIHSNPLGAELVVSLATRFQVDAVLDTGDLTSFGLPIEARIGDQLRRVPVPYLFVPGNHDSIQNRTALGAIPSVKIVDGTVATVKDVTILGVADPTFTATNEMSPSEASAAKVAAASAVAAQASTLRPDVLAVHDALLASDVADVPVVVAGHVHKRTSKRRGGTLVLTVGSTGATGLEAFTVETQRPYEAQILVFRERKLVAVDAVRLGGLTGNVRIERQMYEGN